MKTKWKSNKQYPNTYFAKANNYEEYFKLAKDLWYVFFDAPCLDIDYDNIEEVKLVDPKEYNGEIRNKPEESEYPIIVVFDSDLKDIMWQSMSDLD